MSTFTFHFVDRLPDSTLVLCASNRLSRELKSVLQSRIQPCLNMSVPVATPTQLAGLIHEDLFSRGVISEQLLSRSQFWALMNAKASRGAEAGERLIPAVNEALRSSFQYSEWKMDEASELLQTFEESRYFADLLRSVRNDAELRGALLPNDLIQWATERLGLLHEGALPESLVFYGFLEVTPELEALAGKFVEMGVAVSWIDPDSAEADSHPMAVLPEKSDEWNWAATGIRNYLESGGLGPVALIVDGDESEVEAAGRVLVNRLMSGMMDLTGRQYASPVNIGLAKPLIQQPLVSDLVGLLELAHIPRTPEDMRHALQSRTVGGFLGSVAGKLIKTLSEGSVPEVSYITLVNSTADLTSEDRARALVLTESVKGTATPYAWFRSFYELIEKAGWPAGNDLTGLDKQVVDAVAQAMDEWLGIGWVETRWSRFDALRHLKRVLHQARFNFHTPATPVQVLSPKDAYGLLFDQIWFVGLNEGSWGQPAQMGRFLPSALMRERGASFATSEGRSRYARNLFAGLVGQCNKAVLSCAKRDGETELRPLAFIEGGVDQTDGGAVEHLWRSLTGAEGRVVEDDVSLAPLRTEDGVIGGGVALLKNGLVCWRRGQLVHRLDAETVGAWSKSLPIRDSSSILHKVEQWFWTDYTQSDLAVHSDECLRSIIGGLWDRAAKSHLGWRMPLFDTAQLEREKRQCLDAVIRHLRAEESRPAFEVIEAECERYAEVGPLKFRVRPDRIDRDCRTGKTIVVDYKRTGFGPTAWFGERMSEPQLPVTAVSTDIEVGGLLVAGMTATTKPLQGLGEGGLGDAITAAGEGRNGGELPWGELVLRWRQDLNGTAQRLAEGESEANPIKGVMTCSTCPAAAICRASHR